MDKPGFAVIAAHIVAGWPVVYTGFIACMHSIADTIRPVGETTRALRGDTAMKLVFAIVQDEDVDNLVDALVSEGFRTTRIGSTGSFLRMGNSSLMIGVDDHQVPQVAAIVRRTCRRRKQMAVPYSPALEPGLLYMPENFEVEVGGAVLMVHNVVHFERIMPGGVEAASETAS